MSHNISYVINIAEKISPDLALRNEADSFFDGLENISEDIVTIDFSNICSISRSFAHQYITRKKASRKIIKEINIPDNVVKMLNIVENPKPKRKIIDPDSIQVFTI